MSENKFTIGEQIDITNVVMDELANVADSEIMSVEKQLALAVKLHEAKYGVVQWPAALLPKEYLPLIFSRWLRSLRFGNPMFKHINSDVFYKDYHTFIEGLLSKPDAIVRLAVLPEDANGPEVVIGFCVSREDVLDYIHVQKDAREKGVAKQLLPNGITTFSHITTLAMHIWQPKQNKKYSYLEFNPKA